MKQYEYLEARDLLIKLAEAQPELLASNAPLADRGKKLSAFIWDFIDDFTEKRRQKVDKD